MAIKGSTGKVLYPFDLQIDLCDQSGTILTRNNNIKMTPRSTTASTSAGYGFSAASDYADPSNHNSSTTGWSYDLKVPSAPSGGPWYNYTYGGGSGRRGSANSPNHGTSLSDYGSYASLYMDLAVGSSPHPGIGAAGSIAHIALIHDASGAYFGFQYTSPPPVNYAHARTLFDTSTDAQNIKISGQGYAGGNANLYRQWFCFADRQSWSVSNIQNIRFINWGPNDVHIHSAKLILHGQTGASSGADN
jgi:hypothetical protein